MLRPLCLILLSLYLMIAGSYAYAEEAQPAPAATEVSPELRSLIERLNQAQPLMVIRFNQPHVQYDPSLKRLIHQALMIKPDATITLLGHIPTSTSPSFTEESQRLLSEHITRIHTLLLGQSVKPEQIQQYIVLGSPSGFNEIRVHVE